MTRPYDWQRDGGIERDFPPIAGPGRGMRLELDEPPGDCSWKRFEFHTPLSDGVTFRYKLLADGTMQVERDPPAPQHFGGLEVTDEELTDAADDLTGWAGFLGVPLPPNPRRPR